MNLNIRVGRGLSEHLAFATGNQGDYDNASEYVHSLTRQDKARAEQAAFEAKRAALQLAFGLPDEAHGAVSPVDIKRRALDTA